MSTKVSNHHFHISNACAHVRQNGGVLVAIFFLVLAFASTYFAYSPTAHAAVDAHEVFELTNHERARERVAPLERNRLLDRAAQMKADDMAEKGYYAHVSPEGRTPMYFVERAGYAYRIIGENLVVQRTTAEQVLAAFMGSPGHRTNILRADFSEVGIGVAHGGYKGKTTTFTVQLFGAPVLVVVSPPIVPVEKPASPPPAPVVIPEIPVVATVPRGDAPMTLVPTEPRDVPRVEQVPNAVETVRDIVQPIIDALTPTEIDSVRDDETEHTDTSSSTTTDTMLTHSSQQETVTFMFVPSFIDAPVPVRMTDVSRLDVGTPPLPVESVWSQEWRVLTTDIAMHVRSMVDGVRVWFTNQRWMP